MELKNIAILGPRGNVGTAIITELLKHSDRFTITAISRPTSTYTPLADSKITTKVANFTSFDSLKDAFAGHDTIVNCISGGATQYDPSKLIIDAAVAAGVKMFFANEYIGNLNSEQFRRMPEFFAGGKFRIREYLEVLGKEGKINWTALNGGPFFDMWLMKGPAGFDIHNRSARIYGTGNNPLFWTPLPTIAHAAVNMLLHPGPILNRAIYISSIPGLTQNTILDTLETVLNSKFTITNVDVAQINRNAKIALERGEIGKAMKGLTISNQFYEGDCENDFTGLIENDLVGVKQASIEEAVNDAIQRYGENTPVVDGMYKVDPCEV
ncbi:NAD(P)-binding protein [Lentithecium fluviatile CBS 122367]|uniref:NAD(P)-binding protein n=1 Tax=Lentithecium fluviatile CBS 122367 TaxID=1168545 RepID=A0A6G1IU05_9PLEO|nr:NAD(P)-binding protein [Lentithecium fluviatile CBS 122367]